MSLRYFADKRTIVWIALTTISILFISAVHSFAAQVTLAWDPTDPTPDGYRLYQRIEGHAYDYSQPAWTGPETTCTLNGLADDTTYQFVVRAYVGPDESANSNEIFFITPPPPVTTYTITPNSGANGSITPANSVTVNEGDDQTFNIIPDSGYHILDVKVDGVSVGAASTYTLSRVTDNHTINASFAADTYVVTASAGANGTIAPVGTVNVNHGAGRTYTITPYTGYQIADVIVDGASVGAVSAYTFANVTTNHTINATFKAEVNRIVVTSGINGTISPNGNVEVLYGESQTFTFTADAGFYISGVQIDGQSMGAMGAYTFTDVSADHTLSVQFSENTPVTLWIEAEDGDVFNPMEIADDSNASAGGYIWAPEGTGNFYSLADKSGYTEYHLNLPTPGNYVIWGRQISNTGTSDSFFVSVDGQQAFPWHSKQGGFEMWTWDMIDDEPFNLSAGIHTLRITQREDGTKLDRLLITNQMDMVPSDDINRLDVMEFKDIQVDHNWTRINFQKAFFNPVVVAGPLSQNHSNPAVIRIRNVDSTGFEIQVQEWDYLDGGHPIETVSYLVMEAGNYTLDDGTKIEAANIAATTASSYQYIDFNQIFYEAPVIITSLNSFNESDAVTGRMKNISTDGFEYRLREQELNQKDHAMETLAYIAWETSSGTIGNIHYLVRKTSDRVKHKDYTITFDNPFASLPSFLADMQTTDGGDSANVRCKDKNNSNINVMIDEEQSRDSETRHTTEVVGYIVLGR